MMSALPKKLKVVHVIDMFQALKLPVTDDARQIELKAKELNDFYLRMTGSPDPQKRQQAQDWFKTVTWLKNERQALIEVVREHFRHSAGTLVEAALSGGTRKLSPELFSRLERLAIEQCGCDAPLARSILDEHLLAEGLRVGNALVFPRLIDRLEATSLVKRVDLRWRLPAEECDEVVVKRFPGTGGKSFREEGTELDRGKLTACTDSDVEAGRWYRYRVYSRWRGEISQTGVPIEVLAIGEVSAPKVSWEGDQVLLRWKRPSTNCEVLVFRAPSVVAPLPGGRPEPLPENPQAKCIYRGKASRCRDDGVAEGREVHYLLVASFAPGSFSPGLAVAFRTPVPPPAVTAVEARYLREDAVRLSWTGASRPQRLDYVVVRREGTTPAAAPGDGEELATLHATHYLDRDVVSGKRYTYTVFTRSGDLLSRSGAAAEPVDVLSEVSGLEAHSGEGTVELRWHTPANVHEVIVRRSLSPPDGPDDGTRLVPLGEGRCRDDGLEVGRRYHYLVCCVYRGERSTEVVSAGVRVSSVPYRRPEPVTDLELCVEGPEVHCRWTAPENGQVVVLRSEAPLGLTPGRHLATAELDRLGERVRAARDQARDLRPDVRKPYYSVFTVSGPHAVAGAAGECVVASDVTALRLTVVHSGVELRWTWPPGCTAVTVSRRLEVWPEGPGDRQATHMECRSAEYLSAGGRWLDKLEEAGVGGRFHYVVYARVAGAPGRFFAPGNAPDCRALAVWQPCTTLRYQLSSISRWPRRSREMRLRWRVSEASADFAGFVLRAGRDAVPREDGLEIFRWAPEGRAEGEHEAVVSLEPVDRRGWLSFFCKAFLVDPSQQDAVLFIHPNTCAPITAKGEILEPVVRDGRRFHKGVPKQLICPLCFEEFSVGRMLFGSYDDDGEDTEPRRGRYGWLERMLRRPPQPPKNRQGRRLTRKMCPDPGLHDLPVTAGAQASLVIGLIGAKFSGKSHYVAALVQRLKEQVGGDLQASLVAVTDETQVRYQQEFHDPLFEHGEELPLTAAAPPPLIYDLTFDGRLWGEKRHRAVTLALYDTAGENFDDAKRVRQMVRYLRVASGIIFLVDPLQSAAVREELPPSVPLPDIARMAAPDTVIDRVLKELEKEKVVVEAGPLSTPIAMVMSKCDVLRDAGLIDGGRLWNTGARHVGAFDRELHDDLSGMMGEYLERWNPPAFNTIRQRFLHHAFFGVSATGCAPDRESRRYRFVAPFRVEDPLLWLLAELGVIPSQPSPWRKGGPGWLSNN